MKKTTNNNVDNSRYKVSVVIPCYKSASTIGDVVRGMDRELCKEGFPHEFVLVNDGSGAETFDAIRSLCNEVDAVRGIDLAKNGGQHLAVLTGLRRARGDVIVVMDDDMQTRPDQGILLIEAVCDGADVAFADYDIPRESILRRVVSRLSAYSSCLLTKRPSNLRVNSFYALDRSIAKEVASYRCPNTNLQATILKLTHNVVNVKVKHHERTVGKSGYTLSKLIHVWTSLFNYSNFPASFSAHSAIALVMMAVVLIVTGALFSNGFAVVSGVICGCTALLLTCSAMIAAQVYQALYAVSGIAQVAVREEVTSEDMEMSHEQIA